MVAVKDGVANAPVAPVPPVPDDEAHEVLLVDVQVTRVVAPFAIEGDAAETVTVGGGGGVMVTAVLMLCGVVPLAPVHSRV